jgi:hypothetical protein
MPRQPNRTPIQWPEEPRFFHAHALHPLVEPTPIALVPISQQTTWYRIFGKGFDHLLSGPLRGGMLLHIKGEPRVAGDRQHDQNKQDAKGSRRKREEIDPD